MKKIETQLEDLRTKNSLLSQELLEKSGKEMRIQYSNLIKNPIFIRFRNFTFSSYSSTVCQAYIYSVSEEAVLI